MAADPPPSPPRPEGDPEPGADPSSKPRTRRRVLIGRYRMHSPLPAVEFVGPPGTEVEPPPAAPRPEVPPVPFLFLDSALALAVLTLAAFLASFAATNADLWLHLASGRLVAHGQFPFGADPFSYVAGATWLNHAWLLDLGMYLLYRPGGVALVAAKTAIVVALAAVLLAIRRRSTSGGLAPAVTTTLVLLACSPQFVLRSAVVSYLLFAVLLLILHRGFFSVPGDVSDSSADSDSPPGDSPGAKWKLPLAIGLLFLLWVNVDGGFVFGLLLLAIWIVGAVLQRRFPLGDAGDDPGEASHSPTQLGFALLAAIFACLINPYHVHAFRLPQELALVGMPHELTADIGQFMHEQFGVAALDGAFARQVGPVAADSLYALLAIGLASFAVNFAGWRWRRVLAWMVFAYLGTGYPRLGPYFALVCGPAIVLNVQALLARRRIVWADADNSRADHLRRSLAATARFTMLLALVLALLLAWPGWLGPDANVEAPSRRVAWRVIPDPTMERLAKKLNGWYDAGELPKGEARGFHSPPAFSNYCAWFCPAEKGMVDQRLTAPPQAIADFLALRRAFGLTSRTKADRPEPPDPLLEKAGVTHIVMSGPVVLHAPPQITGLGLNLFLNPNQWPVWAIEGRGVICGRRDSYPKLRIDPTRRAVGDAVEPLPAEPIASGEPPHATTLWDRFHAAPAPVPPETYETGLWLAYRTAVGARSEIAIHAARYFGLAAGRVTIGLPDLAGQCLNTFMPQQIAIPFETAWWRSPEGRSGRSASLLAVRAARRAIRANSADPEAYVRLAQAYGTMDSDTIIGPYQRITAARQAIVRLSAAPYRQTAADEEMVLQEQLSSQLERLMIPGTDAQPLDLILEAQNRFVELRTQLGPRAIDGDTAGFEAKLRGQRDALEQLRAKVRKNLDNWENGAANLTPPQRAAFACRYGLAREALKTLRAASAELDPGSALLMANLALMAGETEDARGWLIQIENLPMDRAPPEFRFRLHMFSVQAAAALGDYRGALEQSEAALDLLTPPPLQLSRAIANLMSPDPALPLARAVTMPLWGGLWRADQVPTMIGDLNQLSDLVRARGDWRVLQGMLALEEGDIPLARKRLSQEAKSRVPFGSRALAQRWIELLTPAP
jgi:hypothetical protein